MLAVRNTPNVRSVALLKFFYDLVSLKQFNQLDHISFNYKAETPNSKV